MESIIQQIRQGSLPDHAQGAVIGGLMPLEPQELLEAIYHICNNNPAHLGSAIETFGGMPEGAKVSFFESKDCQPEIIGFFMSSFVLEPSVLSTMLLNNATPAAAILEVAETLPPELLDQDRKSVV